MLMQPLASIPSPSHGVWHLGPLPLRAYALMIILGIIVAVWVGERRWTARGGTPGTVIDIAVWAVPFGLVGGRIYHVITDNQLYFGSGKNPLDAFKIWNGGLGIWGAVLLGGVGAYIGCRRRGVNLRPFADAIAPGIAFAQAFGRWGNWFNQELYGRPLHAFWALKIDRDHRPRLSDGSLDPKYADISTYHPTFLYESIWCVLVGVLVIWAGKRYRLNWGRSFALYVAAYTVGRAYFEWLRIDSAHHFLGLRLNDYTAVIVFLCAVAYLYAFRDKADVEEVLEPGRPQPVTAPASGETEEAQETQEPDATNETDDDSAEAAVEAENVSVAEPLSNVRIVGDQPVEEPQEPQEAEKAEPAAPAEEHVAATLQDSEDSAESEKTQEPKESEEAEETEGDVPGAGADHTKTVNGRQ